MDRTASISEMLKMRDEMIANGTINIGREITPITEARFRYNESASSVVKEQRSFNGRIIDLRAIRERHLKEMDGRNLLRNSEVNQMSRSQIVKALNQAHRKSTINHILEKGQKVVHELIVACLSMSFCNLM